MYYQNYEDYMRSVLGYPMEAQDTYGMMNYQDDRSNFAMSYQDTKELEDCFPETFRIISPIICDVCDNCPRPVTRAMVDNMVEEVFRRIEVNNEISIKINIDNRSSEKEENSGIKTSSVRNTSSEPVKRSTEAENRQMMRRRNPFLNDLVRILILERLLGGGFFFPGRPPFRPRPPMRPPFPGGPGGGGMPRPPRPGMRDYDDYLRF